MSKFNTEFNNGNEVDWFLKIPVVPRYYEKVDEVAYEWTSESKILYEGHNGYKFILNPGDKIYLTIENAYSMNLNADPSGGGKHKYIPISNLLCSFYEDGYSPIASQLNILLFEDGVTQPQWGEAMAQAYEKIIQILGEGFDVRKMRNSGTDSNIDMSGCKVVGDTVIYDSMQFDFQHPDITVKQLAWSMYHNCCFFTNIKSILWPEMDWLDLNKTAKIFAKTILKDRMRPSLNLF